MALETLKSKTIEVGVANNGTVSAGFEIPSWAIFLGALFPAMDNGIIGMEITMDGTNYYPLLDPADGEDAALVASGSDPGWLDFSDWARFLPEDSDYMMRFTCASQTSGAVTINVLMRG